MHYLQAMRYLAAGDEAKTLWTTEAVQWGTIDEQTICELKVRSHRSSVLLRNQRGVFIS
jgi:hypothetical protein